MGTSGLIRITKACAVCVNADGSEIPHLVAQWLKDNFQGIYRGIGGNKPWNMMNGTEDFAMRLAAGLKQILTEQKRKLVSSYENLPKEPYFNPEIGTLYMLQNPAEVDPKEFDYSVDIIAKQVSNEIFKPVPTHELVFVVNGKKEMSMEEFIQKYSS